MSIESLYINIDHLRDMKTMDDQCNIREIFTTGNDHIANGGTVIIQQEYTNDDPTEVIRLNNADAFDAWIKNYFKVNQ